LKNLQIDELSTLNQELEKKHIKQSGKFINKKKTKKNLTFTLIGVLSFLLIILINFSVDVYLTYFDLVSKNEILALGYISLYFIAFFALFVYVAYTIKNYMNLKNAFLIQKRVSRCRDYEEEKKISLIILDHYTNHPYKKIAQSAINLKKQVVLNSIHSPFEEIKKTILDDLDKKAIDATYKSSKEVALFTALSSGSALDSLVVIFSSVKLMKKVFFIYGYKTNIFTSLLIFRKILENASLSALMEYGDDSVSEVLGNSLFSSVSVKVAQGIGNGVLLLRVGNILVQSARPFSSENSMQTYKQMVKIFFKFIKSKISK